MISFQCVEAFSPIFVCLGENKAIRGIGPKADNTYIVGVGLLQMVSEPYTSRKCGPTREDTCGHKGGGL